MKRSDTPMSPGAGLARDFPSGAPLRQPESTMPTSGVVGDLPARRYPPDRVVGGVGEPQRPVWSGRNPHWAVDADTGELGDLPAGGEPKGSVRPGRDRVGLVDARAGKELAVPAGRDPPDRVAEVVGKPNGLVRAGRDPGGLVKVAIGVNRDLPV